AILRAQQIAGNLDQQSVDTAHIMAGILEIDQDVPQFLFNKIGVNINTLTSEIRKEIETFPKVEGTDKQYLTNDANQVLSRARKNMKLFSDEFISIEVLLLAVIQGKDRTGDILRSLGATEDLMIEAIKNLRKGRAVVDQHAENQYN